MQIAIADDTGKVSLWCEHNGVDKDGFLHFYVINGAWKGKFKDNIVHITATNDDISGYLVWSGTAGLQKHANGRWSKYADNYYNEAIAWIQDLIDSPDYVMSPLNVIYEYQPKYDDYEHDDEIPF
jgi:hypothetical protein